EGARRIAALSTSFLPASRLDQILLHAQILDDEILPLGRVRAHEERQEFVGAVEMVEVDRVEADILPDEILELAGGDFAEALEARDLVAGAERGDGGMFLLLAIAILRDLLVAHAEERRLEDEEVIVADDVREKLEEEREQQQ